MFLRMSLYSVYSTYKCVRESRFWRKFNYASVSQHFYVLQLLYLDGNDRFKFFVFVYFFAGLQCAGHSFAYVAHFVFQKDI
jgi:hypothetical protein